MVTTAKSDSVDRPIFLWEEGPVFILVLNAGTVRVSDDPNILQQNSNEGLVFTAMTNPLPSCMIPRWKGPLFIIGSVPAANGGVPVSIITPTASRESRAR